VRRVHWLILVFWLASSTWLTWTKLIPPLRTGDPPRYQDVLPDRAVALPPVHWSIQLNGRPLGTASNEVSRQEDGNGCVRSEIQIEGLSVQDLLQPTFGMLGSALQRSLGQSGPGPELDLTVENQMFFDAFGQLQAFECRVDVADLDEWIRLRGTVHETQLRLSAFVGRETGDVLRNPPPPVFRSEVELPADRLVADSLSPRPQFGHLQVGQKWTFQMYRPLLPNQPLELVEAHVDRQDEIEWNGQTVSAFHVVYRRAAGSILSLDQDLGQLWVLTDGTVVRQTLQWGSLVLTFDRQPDGNPQHDFLPPSDSERGRLDQEASDQ
jgi:hypothetical protein